MVDNNSPLQVQYRRIKNEHKDKVLFFRLGDFYEMFMEDAIEVSKLLNLTLTHRKTMPMCGVPYHSCRSYIARLLKFGKKVAICDQITVPGQGKGILERKVVEIITPGTTVEDDFLDKGSSNYLACLHNNGKIFSFAYIELSCGEFCATSFPVEQSEVKIRQELERLDIKEIILQESILTNFPDIAAALTARGGLLLNSWQDWVFEINKCTALLLRQFGLESLKSFGLDNNSPEIFSAGALLEYIAGDTNSVLQHIRKLNIYGEQEFLGIDESTSRNLEIVRNLKDGSINYSLFEVCDKTKTSMGKRLLKQRLTHPLLNIEKIENRLSMVEYFYNSGSLRSDLRTILSQIPDIERQCARLAMNKSHGKDLLALKNALESLKKIGNLLTQVTNSNSNPNSNGLRFESQEASLFNKDTEQRLADLKNLLENTICEDPSTIFTEGKLIKHGFNAQLDRLNELHSNGRVLLEEYLEEEKKNTGINNLKIRYNRMIGYFFEVSNNHIAKIPAYFIKRQGVLAGERFSTERLASLESEINGALDKIIELEKTLFFQIRDDVKKYLNDLTAAACIVAEIDAAQSFAESAELQHWVKPQIDGSKGISIIEGRHPVVEAHINRNEFIPNDLLLSAEPVADNKNPSFMLITGPNMAGKSTYLRQAALIILMAQTGSFVPASKAQIGIVDRIYCRVGASDNLARGESTFFVEMNETAYILNTASEGSFVIMDEVGRGTSAKDGLAIAQAVCEHLLNNIKCRTLFATHYHELTLLEHPALINCSLEVDDTGNEIVFLRRLRAGPAIGSYGLHVARLAGIGNEVLSRSAEILKSLEGGEAPHAANLRFSATPQAGDTPATPPLPSDTKKLIKKICNLDIDNLTPITALTKLESLKKDALEIIQKTTSTASNSPKKPPPPPELFD
ncbi:MAG: DNA mismatch repair protein MutS [Termitinemataceae bacterium]|nr:MAG: DNA mismatch repair protein MutS [Termitinemataceae bacterium]